MWSNLANHVQIKTSQEDYYKPMNFEKQGHDLKTKESATAGVSTISESALV